MDGWALLCYIVASAVYLNTLSGKFVYDDRRAILENEDVNGQNSFVELWKNDYWGTPILSSGSHGSYRPLSVISFRLNYWFTGYNPWSYHLVNIILHVVATGLVLKLGDCLLCRKAARLSALLFAVHPIHTEAVASIVGRAELIACIFYLASLLCYIKYREHDHTLSVCESKPAFSKAHIRNRRNYSPKNRGVGNRNANQHPRPTTEKKGATSSHNLLGLTMLFACLSTFSKETGFAALPVCIFYELLLYKCRKNGTNSKSSKRNIIILAVSVAILLLSRLSIAGFHMPTFSSADNPIAKSRDFLTRLYTLTYLPVFNFLLCIFPYALSYDWGMKSIPKVASIFDPRNILSFLFYFSLHVTVQKSIFRCLHFKQTTKGGAPNNRKSLVDPATLLFAIVLSIIPFLPSSNLFFYVGFVVAERTLYIPSIGLCLLVGYGYQCIPLKFRNPVKYLFFVCVIILGIRSVLRNENWQTEEKLYRSSIEINPAKAYGNLGTILSEQGRLDEAEDYLRKALRKRHTMADAQFNLGLLLEKTNREKEAIRRYTLALKYRPNLGDAYVQLGKLLWKMNRDQDAIKVLQTCVNVDMSDSKEPKRVQLAKTEAMLHLGLIREKKRSYEEALMNYVKAIASSPSTYKLQMIYVGIGETLFRMKNYEDADRWFDFISGEAPITALEIVNLNSFSNCSTSLRRKCAQVMDNYNFRDSHLQLQYGQLLLDERNYIRAAIILRKAYKTDPSNFNLVQRTASTHKVVGLLEEAEYYYKRLIQLRPDERTYSELAEVLLLRNKLEELTKIHKLFPHNKQFSKYVRLMKSKRNDTTN